MTGPLSQGRRIRRHDGSGRTWPATTAEAEHAGELLDGIAPPTVLLPTVPTPATWRAHAWAKQRAAVLTAVLRQLAPARHLAGPATDPHHRASVHVTTGPLDATELAALRGAPRPAPTTEGQA